MRKRENMVEKGSQEYDERQISMSRGRFCWFCA